MKKDRAELNDASLENVNGGACDCVALNPSGKISAGTAYSHNMPKINPDEKYIMDAAPPAADIISELKS